MSRPIDLTGQRYGRLVVVDRMGSNEYGQAEWLCVCDCGNKVTVQGRSLKTGHTKSCGCLRRDLGQTLNAKHNDSGSRLFSIWSTMKKRTTNKNYKDYAHYGGRGITVCSEWENSFLCFREWALQNGYAEALTIDRIDNNKGYSPDNCRWVSMKTQANNKSSNRCITYNGETRTRAEWGQLIGGNATLIRDRLDRLGWSVEKALTTPVKGKE